MKHVFTFALLLGITFFSVAQDKGGIYASGYCIHTDSKGKKSALPDMNIIVYKGTEKIDELKTNKKGHFDIDLDYGPQYRVAFEGNEDYIDMSFAVDAKMPPDKQKINANIVIDFIAIDKGDSKIDTLKFKFPFTKFKFDGNKKFVDDEKYLNDFIRGAFKEYKEAQKQVKKQQAEKVQQTKLGISTRYILVGGKLMSAGPPVTPLRHAKISLTDEKGTVVETISTDKYGKFSFTKLAADKNFFIKMDESDSMPLPNSKMIMYNKEGKEVMAINTDDKGVFKFQLLGSDKVNLSKLVEEDSGLLIAGKFEVTGADEKSKPLARAKVTLANPVTAEVYEMVETDGEGRFVFSKLPPDKNYVIRLEEGNPELANLKITLRDKTGGVISTSDADGFGKFRFQFLASDESILDAFEVDDGDLKMDLQGKLLTGGEKNTPLSGVKINLLDDKGAVLQSASCSEKGIFSFKNLILFKGYYFQVDGTDPKVAPLTAIAITEKNDKPVKEYTITSKQDIKYRLLPSDQKRLARLYLK